MLFFRRAASDDPIRNSADCVKLSGMAGLVNCKRSEFPCLQAHLIMVGQGIRRRPFRFPRILITICGSDLPLKHLIVRRVRMSISGGCLDYSGGQVTDWGGHFNDMAQWGMGTDHTGPVKIQHAKATWAKHPVWNTATEFYFECIYNCGVKLIVQNVESGIGVGFEGTEGKIWVNRSEPENLIYNEIGPDEIHLYESEDNHRNFIDCVISRARNRRSC